MVSEEFQKLLSFSWNCELMVPSAASHGATRPSYFGPNSPKFSSAGLAASAGSPNASTAPSAASIRPKCFKGLVTKRLVEKGLVEKGLVEKGLVEKGLVES